MTDINGIVEEQISRWEATRFYVENDFPLTISKGNSIIDEIISAWLAIQDVLALKPVENSVRMGGEPPAVRRKDGRYLLRSEVIEVITNRLGE